MGQSRLSLTEWALVVLVALAFLVLTGCVKTTRFVLDKEGNVTERIETIEPSIVAVYGGPVLYTGSPCPPGTIYDGYACVYPRSYRAPIYVETVYLGGRPHHHHRPHRHRWGH